jgi:signal transduction histidine kinase
MTATTSRRTRHAAERAGWPARARTLSLVPAAALLACLPLVDPATACAFAALAATVLLHPGSVAHQACYGAAVLAGGVGLAQGDSQSTATALATLGLAGLVLQRGRRTVAQLMAGSTLLVGVTAGLGHLYGVDSLYRVGAGSTMSVATAAGLVAASVAVGLAAPYGVLQWLCFGTDSGARAQRVLVPVALLLIPGAAWLYVQGLEAGVYGVPMGTAMMTSFVAVVIVAVGYRTGRTAFLMDRERDTLLDELHRVNSELEDWVRVKAHQLNRQKSKLALFEERDRIARDLHDRVIQRIFAAGLQMSSLGRIARKDAAADGGDSALADSLDLVAMELDLAIRELRNSIFELTSVGDHDDLEQVVRDLAARASRILGFMPRVDVRGQVAGVSAELVAQLASVIQEGLSNVARHAQASGVEVAVQATGSDLTIRITDDGVGLPDPLPRSSGISNLMQRARQLGGSATWGNREPTGTVLTWRVPRAGESPAAAQGNQTPVASSDRDHSAAASAAS